MISVRITQDKARVMEVPGPESTRWLLFTKLIILLNQEAWFAVSATRGHLALRRALPPCLTCIQR
jgi:hypothetical protein